MIVSIAFPIVERYSFVFLMRRCLSILSPLSVIDRNFRSVFLMEWRYFLHLSNKSLSYLDSSSSSSSSSSPSSAIRVSCMIGFGSSSAISPSSNSTFLTFVALLILLLVLALVLVEGVGNSI